MVLLRSRGLVLGPRPNRPRYECWRRPDISRRQGGDHVRLGYRELYHASLAADNRRPPRNNAAGLGATRCGGITRYDWCILVRFRRMWTLVGRVNSGLFPGQNAVGFWQP